MSGESQEHLLELWINALHLKHSRLRFNAFVLHRADQMIKPSLISAWQPWGASSSCCCWEQSRSVLQAARLPIHLHASRHAELCPVMLNEVVCSRVHVFASPAMIPDPDSPAASQKPKAFVCPRHTGTHVKCIRHWCRHITQAFSPP